MTMLPLNLSEPLRRHLLRVKAQHEQDLEDGFGSVHLPFALARKLPKAAREWPWQYAFPSSRLSIDPRTGEKRRHHIAEGLLQSALKRAVDAAGIVKRANCHSFTPLIRHIFAVERIRYPNRAGASRTQGRQYDDDLHARAQQTGRRCKESFGLRSDRKHRTLNIESRITPGRRRGRRGAAGRRRERRLAWAVFRAPVFGWGTRQRRVAD